MHIKYLNIEYDRLCKILRYIPEKSNSYFVPKSGFYRWVEQLLTQKYKSDRDLVW